MTAIDWLVIAGGTSAVAWVNWYFFAAEGAGAVAALAGGGGATTAVQQATVTVKGGYSPAVVRAKAGQPVRLTFDRQEASGCSEEVVFGDFGIRRYLPAQQQTVIEVTPPVAGTYEFTCGMGMLRGKLVAE
jgi:plastocyanin domain-containing protein